MGGEVSAGRILGWLGLLVGAWLAYWLDERNPSPPRATPRINALLSAIGMSILLQNLVRIAVGSDTQTFPQMDSFTGLDAVSFPFAGIEIQYIEEFFGEFPRRKVSSEVVARLDNRDHQIVMAEAALPDDPGTVVPVAFTVSHEIRRHETDGKLADLSRRDAAVGVAQRCRQPPAWANPGPIPGQ